MASDFSFASGSTRVTVKGLAKTSRALTKAGVSAEDQKALMFKIGSLVVNAAEAPRLTGALATSVRAGKGKTKAVVRAGGAKVPYAGVIHYGWPARNIAPNPFLTNAVQRERGAVLSTLDQGIDDLLRKAELK